LISTQVTDEDAFKALAPFGAVGVLVAPADGTFCWRYFANSLCKSL